MSVADFLGYLAPFNPFSLGSKEKSLPLGSGVSLLPTKEVTVLKPDQLKSMDQSIALSNFFAILGGIQGVIQFVTKGVEAEGKRAYRYFSEHYYSYRLKSALERGLQAFKRSHTVSADVKEPSQEASRLIAELKSDSSPEEVSAFLSDETQLKALSNLRQSSSAPPIEEEVFEAVFHGRGTYRFEALPKVLAFLKSFLSPSLISSSGFSALGQAQERDVEFRQLIAESKAKPAKERKAKLRDLAIGMKDSVQELSCGESFVTISGVHNGKTIESPLVETIFSNFLPKDLHELLKGDRSEVVIQKLTEQLKVAIWGEKKPSAGMGKKIEEMIRGALANANGAAERVLPEVVLNGIKNSLKQDLEEILFGSPTADGAERLGEKIWADLKDRGIEKVIQESLLNAIQSSRLVVEAQMDIMNEQVAASLPTAAKPILETIGLPKGEEEAVWFEFKRQVNGQFKLTLFAQGSAAEPHPSGQTDDKQGILLPLTYSDIDPTSLDEAFFYSLLSYRAIPEWEAGTRFTIQNIHNGLIASLNKAPDAPTNQTLMSLEKMQGEGIWKYVSLYMRHHLGIEPDEFDRMYSYNVRMQAFISMWAHVQNEPDYLSKHPLIAQRFRVAVSELSDEGLELYKRGALPLNELKSLFATIWEAEKELNVELPPAKTAASVIVPPDLQEMAKKLVLAIGVSPTQISLIKEALIVVYGSDIEDVVDQAFRDVLPTLTTDEMNETKANQSSDNLYTWAGVQRTAHQLKNFRLSLFHFVRLYVRASKIWSDIFTSSLASRMLEFLIIAYFPAILGYTSISVGTLSKLLVCFGPSILKPILPDPIYQSVRSIYRLVKEVMSYVQRRLIFATIRVIVRILLGGETASKLSVQARNWSQKMTRSGELSYLIPYGKNDLGHLRLKPLEKPITPESTEEAPAVKPKIGKKITPYGSTSALPRPYQIKLTKENLQEELSKWILEAEVLGNDQGLDRAEDSRKYQRLLYINRQFRNLELPSQTTLWDEVDPIETMKLLQQVISSMGIIETMSSDEQAEIITTTYTAYALMDYLARRSSEAQLPTNLQANGCDFGVWLQSPATRVVNPKTYLQLEKTARYFGFDLEKVYTEDEIDRRRPHCLFNYEGKGERFFTPAFTSEARRMQTSYLGFRYSREGEYYRQLLRTPAIQNRLKHAPSLNSKSSEWEQFKALFCNEAGALPEAFDMLRSMDQSARRCVECLTLSARPMKPATWNGGCWWIPERVTNCFHALTFGFLREQTFYLNNDTGGIQAERFSTEHKSAVLNRVVYRGKEHFGDEKKKKQTIDESYKTLLCRLKERTVNQVMAESPVPITDLPVHEARLLEMINSDKEDQVMQVLSYFNRAMGRLREPRFRMLFDLYINRLGALQCQLKQRSDLPEAIGAFFKEALDQFDRQEDIETCLYLTKTGQELQRTVGSFSGDAFPDFRSYIRYRLIPHLRNIPSEKRTWKFGNEEQDLIVISYYHLVLSYGLMNPDKASEDEKKQAIEDIARLVYTSLPTQLVSHLSKPDVMIKAEEVLFLWEPYIKEAMQTDPTLRKEVIEGILRDVGMGSMIEKEDEWNGTYPVFSNGRITLDLTQKTQSAHEIPLKVAEDKASLIVSNPGKGIRLTERTFSFPEKKVIVEFPEGTYRNGPPCILYRQFAGVDYEYLPSARQELLQAGQPFSLAQDETLWLERPRFGQTCHLLCMKGEEKNWRRPVREVVDEQGRPVFEVRWNRKVIDGMVVREVNLAEEPHGLALLNWFEDESAIKAYAHAHSPDQLAFIEIPGRGLRFEVREHAGDLQAMALGDATGYFLAKKQRDEHLLKYGKYLLLENTSGKKKAYIATKPLKALMADFVIGNLGQIKTSPLIERYISNLAPDILGTESKLLSFDVDANGNLTTSDPLGLAYLALFNFINGDREASLHYFSEVEAYGRKYPFPKEIYHIFELMYLPLLCGQDRFSREMALRLGAIQAENQLIQHSEETGETTKPVATSETTKLLQWVLLQVKYAEYLKGVKEGLPATLSDFQELFLLTGMSQINQQYYQKHIGRSLSETVRAVSEKVGLENLANSFLFSPDVMERYHELRLQLDKGSQLTNMSRGVVIQAIQSIFSQNKEQVELEGQTKGGLSQMIHLVDQAKNSALLRSVAYSFSVESFHQDVEVCPALETVPTALWELDQVALRRNFPLYYRLAKNERSWGGDAGLFARKRKELLRSLELMQGNYTAEESLQREILRVVSTGSKLVSFPSANRLERAIAKRQQTKYDNYSQIRWFETFIENELVSPCRRAQFSHKVLQTGLASKSWKVIADGLDKALYFTPGCFLPYPVRLARCVKETVSLANAVRTGDQGTLKQGMRVGAQFGDVVVNALFPEYELFAWGLSWLPWVPRSISLCRAANQERQREVAPSQSVTSRARSQLSKEPLDSTIAQELKRVDAAINRSFDDLFDRFFNGEQRPLPIDSSRVNPYDTSSPNEALTSAFEDVNQSLNDYYDRPPERQLEVQLKQGKDAQEFIERAYELTQVIGKHLQEQEEKIVEVVRKGKKQHQEDPGVQIVQKINRQKFGEETLSFQQIYELFTHCDDEALLKRTELHPDKWKDLKIRLYKYQTLRRRFNLLFNQIDQLRKGGAFNCEVLARELKRRPAYDLAQNVPEIILRAKLSYEVALEFMLYETALQSKQLDRLLEAHCKEKMMKAVLEQIMGTGKTFLVPISDRVFADGKHLVFNVVIDPVAPSNFNSFIRNTKKTFNQIGSIFRFNRSMTWATNQLWAFSQVLQRALHLGEHMNARQKDLQAYELRFIEEVLDIVGKFEQGSKGEWKKRLQHYKDGLALLRKKGIENSDEKHKIDEPSSGILNFPLGKHLVLQDEEIQVMNEIMLLLLTTPDFNEYITIKAKRPEKLPVKVYRNKIKTALAKQIASLEMLGIDEAHRAEFVEYLKGKATSIPSFVMKNPHKRAIGQAKGCVTVLLEHALRCVINVDFTVSKEGNGEYTRPAGGNDDPLEDSTDLKPDINYIRTLMRLFQTRLTTDQLKRLFRYLKEEAETSREKLGCHIQETSAGRFFALHCPGYQIDTYKDEDLPKILAMLNESDRAMTLYATQFIAKDIKFYDKFLSSNFANFHSMFKKQFSRTGTPKRRLYPQRTEILSHPGTEGESAHVLEKKIGDASIHVLEESDPKPALRELTYRFFHPNPKALAFIDLDPLCNNMSAEDVNEEFQRYINEHRPELQGTAFYNKNKELVMAEKGSSHTIPFEESTIPMDKRISIFTHTQTTGSDIPQDPEAEAILTIGENVTFTAFAQAYDRMRGARRGKQKVILVMTKRAQQNFNKRLGKGSEYVPKLRELLRIFIENEMDEVDPDYYLAGRYLLHDTVRRAVLDKAEQVPTIEETIAIIRKFREIFIMKVTSDPFEAYGHIDVMMDPEVVLKSYRASMLKVVKDSGYFNRQELNDIEAELNLVEIDRSKGKVHVYKKKGGTESSDELLSQHAHQSQDQASDNENEQNSEVDNENHVNVNQNAAPPAQPVIAKEGTHAGYTWSQDLDPTDVDSYFRVAKPSDWRLPGPVPIYSLREFLKIKEEFAFLEEHVSSLVYVTENFAQRRDNRYIGFRAEPIEPLGKRQTPVYKALVIQDRRSGCLKQKILLLHKDEVPFWREKLSKLNREEAGHPDLKLALYDFGTRTVMGDEIQQDVNFKRAITQVRFINGELAYSQEEQENLLRWIKSLGVKRMRKTFEKIHQARPVGSYPGSHIDTAFFLAADVPLDMRIRV